MKILVTGASGFIGTSISSYLNNRGFDLVLINKENGFDLSSKGWTKKIKEKKIDIVIHLAQSSMYRDFDKGAEDMFDVNIASTFELLKWSKENHVRRFIYSSTGSVYKNSFKKSDEKSPVLQNSFYSTTKLISEQLIFSFSDYFETTVLRLFTVYGFGQRNMLIPNIIEKIKTGSEIILSKGEGINISPIHIYDLNIIFEEICTTNKNLNKQIINVSGDEVISLGEIVNHLSLLMNKNPVIKINKNSVKSLISDNSKLKTFLPNDFVFLGIKQGLVGVLDSKN
jgi:UDP-glucose 4-epimerase